MRVSGRGVAGRRGLRSSGGTSASFTVPAEDDELDGIETRRRCSLLRTGPHADQHKAPMDRQGPTELGRPGALGPGQI